MGIDNPGSSVSQEIDTFLPERDYTEDIDIFVKACETIWLDEEYRPGISELQENKIICRLWDKDIRLSDFLDGSKELRENVIKKLQERVNQSKDTKNEIIATFQSKENSNNL